MAEYWEESNFTEYDLNSYEYFGDIENLKKPWIKEAHLIPSMIIYGVTLLIGVIGNVLVIYSVMCDKKSRSVTTSFMVSLAVADILFLCVCVPYELTDFILVHWALGPIMCKVSKFIEMLSAMASILNLSSVSVERFIVIVMPMKSRRWCTAGNSHKILIIVWSISCALASPALYIMNTKVNTYYNNVTSVTVMYCTDSNIDQFGSRAFIVYKMMLMFALPTVVMTVCYTGVIYALWISSRQLSQLASVPRLKTSSSTVSMERMCLRVPKDVETEFVSGSPYRFRNLPALRCRTHSVNTLKARKQVIKMLIVVVLAFLLCWGPPLMMDVILKYDPFIGFNQSAFYIKMVFGCLPYVQSCLNPFIYCFMSQKFRQNIVNSCGSHRSMCLKCKCCKQKSLPFHVTFELDSKVSNGTVHTRLSAPNSSRSGSTDENTCLSTSGSRCLS